jgi:cytochrome P450
MTYLGELGRQGTDLIFLTLGPYRAVFLTHPDLIEEVLVKRAGDFRKISFMRRAHQVMGDGLITIDGHRWETHRKALQPALHRERIAAYGEVIAQHAQQMVQRWSAGDVRDVYAEAMSMTAGLLVELVCGMRVDGEQGHAIDRDLRSLMRRMTRADPLSPFLGRLPLVVEPGVYRAVRRLRQLIGAVIEARRTCPGTDIASVLLEADLTTQEIEDEVLTLLLAGHEPTAAALSWVSYLVALHPETAERLREEWEVLDSAGTWWGDLKDLPYTAGVVREALRLYPPGVGMAREAVSATEVGGHHIGKGTVVFISQYMTQRDPRSFERPDEFMPDRWTGGLAERLPRFAYFPFGGGARHCVGYQIAMAEMQIGLAAIGRRYRLSVPDGSPLRDWIHRVRRPRGGVHLRVEDR